MITSQHQIGGICGTTPTKKNSGGYWLAAVYYNKSQVALGMLTHDKIFFENV